MAAIAGMIGTGGARERVTAMLDTMAHRGADTRNVRVEGETAAGVRAATLSAARGDGFACADGIAVLFDGDIYNDREPGESDADVVLRLYASHGMAFPACLEGVFAVAVIVNGRVLLARDPVGVRPLYWGRAPDGTLVFASELKALAGMTEAVEELLPGATFSSELGIAGYVPVTPDVRVPDAWPDAAAALRTLVLRAVERRLDDGAIGACLMSGGLDSSIIAACVKALGGDMPLMTVGYEGGAPDIANAKLVAEHLGMKHIVRVFTAREIEDLTPRAVRTLESFDEDCVSGAISNLFASDLARRTTNCVLSGEGGDELFGGYHLLKDVPTESGRLLMMRRLIEVAYNTAVQRLDRSMMGNGIHYRTPFLDTDVMAFAAHLPVSWKIHRGQNGEWVEKWLLREAFKDLLPDAIYKRSKLRFSGGTGTDTVMDEIARRHVAADEFTETNRRTPGGYSLNSPKELWYYRIFKEQFPAPAFERLVGRWDPGKFRS